MGDLVAEYVADNNRLRERIASLECELASAVLNNVDLRDALRTILRTSHDGESMRIAAEALRVPVDNTEPEAGETDRRT